MPAAEAYLLDTGILIVYARGKEPAQEMEKRFHFSEASFKPIVCVVTLGEIRAFAEWNRWR